VSPLKFCVGDVHWFVRLAFERILATSGMGAAAVLADLFLTQASASLFADAWLD
jgi:hypothetical protein